MTTYHGLCGFIGGMGVNHEVDMVDLTTHQVTLGADGKPKPSSASSTNGNGIASTTVEEEAAKAAAYEKILDEKAQQQRNVALHEQLERLLSVKGMDAKDDEETSADRMSFNTADDCTYLPSLIIVNVDTPFSHSFLTCMCCFS
jgi:hypothetical protein